MFQACNIFVTLLRQMNGALMTEQVGYHGIGDIFPHSKNLNDILYRIRKNSKIVLIHP